MKMHLPAVKRACTFAIALCMCDSNYYRNCCSFVARISIKSLCKFFIQLTFTLRASPTHSLSNSLVLRTAVLVLVLLFSIRILRTISVLLLFAHRKREPFSDRFSISLSVCVSCILFSAMKPVAIFSNSRIAWKINTFILIQFNSINYVLFRMLYCIPRRAYTHCGRPIFMRYYCMNVSVP